MAKKVTTADFIARAKAKHGDYYGYENSVYVGSKVKIEISCPIHGPFKQYPRHHTEGSGCRECRDEANRQRSLNRKLLASSEFVSKARSVHGDDRYDYSQTTYIKSDQKVQIGCKVHGPFTQWPSDHLKGRGCRKCHFETLQEFNRSASKQAANDFEKCAREVHGDLYNYERVVYVGNDTKVEIICEAHGSFWQEPQSHLRDVGCPKCGLEKIRTHNKARERLAASEFEQKARLVHGEKYNYSKVQYCGKDEKVLIGCPEHGYFEITPHSHLNSGSGCSKCSETGFNPSKPGRLYLHDFGTFLKVGITNLSAHKRLVSMTLPGKQKLAQTIVDHEFLSGADALSIECQIKEHFSGRMGVDQSITEGVLGNGHTETLLPIYKAELLGVIGGLISCRS